MCRLLIVLTPGCLTVTMHSCSEMLSLAHPPQTSWTFNCPLQVHFHTNAAIIHERADFPSQFQTPHPSTLGRPEVFVSTMLQTDHGEYAVFVPREIQEAHLSNAVLTTQTIHVARVEDNSKQKVDDSPPVVTDSHGRDNDSPVSVRRDPTLPIAPSPPSEEESQYD